VLERIKLDNLEKVVIPKNNRINANSNEYHNGDTQTLTNEDIARVQSILYSATGGELNPQLHKRSFRQFGNPAPLGLCGFALTTFVLSMINVQARSLTEPNIVIGLAFFYGGLVQLLAGMWEMAVGNTFGATALSSYGGFWLSFACIFVPFFDVEAAYSPTTDGGAAFSSAVGIYLIGWFIFTFILVLCTTKSTVAFFSLFFTLDLAFLFLAIGYFKGGNTHYLSAGGAFGLMAAFLAWWCALAGIVNEENSWFSIPLLYFPWSPRGDDAPRKKTKVTKQK